MQPHSSAKPFRPISSMASSKGEAYAIPRDPCGHLLSLPSSYLFGTLEVTRYVRNA